jgi:lipopolysaccharide/colanic/teichoic acid biosynthesis glycosyltransferase
MNSDTKTPPPLVGTDEAISLIEDDTPITLPTDEYERNNKMKSEISSRKSSIQNRLMRWCAFVLSIGTIVLIWRFLSILILALWLSSICRPLLEWLVNHL